MDFSNAVRVGSVTGESQVPVDIDTNTQKPMDFSNATKVVKSTREMFEDMALNDIDQERVGKSRQGEDESTLGYWRRITAEGFERAVVTGLDTVIPDDVIDRLSGQTSRGIDPDAPWINQMQTRLMSPKETHKHRAFIRENLTPFSGQEPMPPTATQGNPLSGTETAVRFLAAGTEGGGDITNLATTAPRIIANVAQSILPSAVADLAVNEAASALEGADLSTSTKQNILLGMGIAGGVTTSLAQSTLPILAISYKNVKQLNPSKEVTNTLNKYQTRFAERVAEHGGDFSLIMEEAYAIQEALGGTPLKIIPIAAAMQNDIMKGQFNKFYGDGGDAKFRANINEAIKEFEEAQGTMLKRLTEGPTPATEGLTLPDVIKRETDKRTLFETKRQEHLQSRIEQADAKIYEVTNKLTKVDAKTDIGAAAQGLLNNKKKLVKQRLTPMYNEWKENAKANFIELDTEGVDNMLGWINNLPTDEGKFLAKFSPLLDVVKRTEIDPESGVSLETYKAVDLLGLKNQINGRLRDLSSTTDSAGRVQQRILNDFKEGPLASALDDLPDGYGQTLNALDALYYKEVGIPFDSAGVAKMSVTKFTTTVANDLIKLQNARDFISAMGDQGIPVLKDAIYAKINGKAIKGTDPANEKIIAAWLTDEDNAQLISLVPNLRDELSDAASSISNAKATMSRLKADSAINSYQATDDFLKLVRGNGLDGTVNKLIKSGGASMDDILPLLKDMDIESEIMFRTGIRLQLVEKAMNNKSSTTAGATKPKSSEFIRKNREVFTEFFGKGYIEEVDLAMKAFDVVSEGAKVADIPVRSAAKANELLASTVGMPASEILALQRRTNNNQMSPVGAASVAVSKVGNFLLQGKKEARLKELVYDPIIVTKLAKLYKEYAKVTLTDRGIAVKDAMQEVILNNTRRGIFIGAREERLNDLTQGEQQQQEGQQ